MINGTWQTQENKTNTTINHEREIEEDGNSGQVTLQTDNKVEKREGGDFQRTSTAQCLVNCAAI